MTTLLIYKLDSNDDPVSTLQAGEHIFGRGPLLKCTDRRVSRAHGVIKFTDEAATITSTHINPCFYQSANSTTITILPKDNPVDIGDGDKFALLADQFWFRIKIAKTNSFGCTENEKLSPLARISMLESNTTTEDALQTTQIANRSTNKTNDETLKREHQNDSGPSNSKKAKLENEDETNQLLTVLNDLQKVTSESEDESSNVNQTKNKDLLSESDDEDMTLKVKPSTSKKGRKKPPKKAVKKNESSALAQTTRDAELAMLFSSDDEDEQKGLDVESNNVVEACFSGKCSDEEKDGDKKNNGSDSKDSNKCQNVDVAGTSYKKKNDSHDGDQSSKTDQNKDVAGTSSSDGTRVKRDQCWYALSCYRKSDVHLAEYSHPGDSDYEPDPSDDRPMCSFGAACYRRNKDHRRDYKHPNGAQKPDKKPKKKKVNAPGVPKKRTARKKYNDSSDEDDYDLEDPFLDDSGTEYEATSSSDDSDSDWSGGGSEEETRRLLKEAKKFTKGKKKGDDDE